MNWVFENFIINFLKITANKVFKVTVFVNNI